MISTRLAQGMAARNLHYGWVVAGVTFLTMLATAGAMGSAGVMVQPLQTEFGWTTEQISTAMAVRLVLYGLFGPFAAAFMNQWGIRRVAGFALTMIMGGILLSHWMTELWHLIALWGVIIGIGTGMTALVLGATVATRWFGARRGLVVGLMTAANATGSLVFLPMIAAVTETFGWRNALATLVGVLMLTLVLIGSGWLSDRYDNRWLLFWFYGLRGLSLIYLPFSNFSIYELSLFAIFYGLDWVATVPPTVRLTADKFGPDRAPMVFGWVFTGHQLGAAAAAWFAGSVRTGLESYMPALLTAGVLCLVAALAILLIKRPARGDLRTTSGA